MSLRTKIVILTQEVIRRCKNISRRVPVRERIAVLDRFIIKWLDSGNPEAVRREVIESGLAGYYKMLEKEILVVERVNKPGSQGKNDRQMNKFSDKENWYKEVHAADDIEAETVAEPEDSSLTKLIGTKGHEEQRGEGRVNIHLWRYTP